MCILFIANFTYFYEYYCYLEIIEYFNINWIPFIVSHLIFSLISSLKMIT